MYNCPTFFLFWKCLADMSYWTNLYPTVADNELHFFHNFKLELYSFCEPCPYTFTYLCINQFMNIVILMLHISDKLCYGCNSKRRQCANSTVRSIETHAG